MSIVQKSTFCFYACFSLSRVIICTFSWCSYIWITRSSTTSTCWLVIFLNSNNCACLTKICDIKFVSTSKSIKQIIVVLFVDVTDVLIDIVIIKARSLLRFKSIFNVSTISIKLFLFSTIDFDWDCVAFAFTHNFHTRNQKQYDSTCHMNNKNDRQILTMRNFDHDFDFHFFFHLVDFVAMSKIDFDYLFERCQI